MDISVHTIVPDAGAAADWYTHAFGARELSRVPLPGGRVMSVVVAVGESQVHVGSEVREAGSSRR
jgi:PhnB protein